MDLSRTEYVVDDESLDVEAWLDGRKIGYAWCERTGDRLKVADLHVGDAYRRRGIGSELLRRVLRAADAAGILEVWGVVTADDLARWPGLLDWYRRHGFGVAEPDGETAGG